MAYGLSSAPFDHERNSEEGRMEAGGRPEGRKERLLPEGGRAILNSTTYRALRHRHDTVRTSESVALC